MGKLLRSEHTDRKGRTFITLYWWCPGCNNYHGVSPDKHHWNGSMDKPTFTPSLLCSGPTHNPPLCHSYMTNGKIKYLGDCEHKLKGQTVDLPDFPDDVLDWIPRG